MSSEENMEQTATEMVDDSPTELEAPTEVSLNFIAGSCEAKKSNT
jgi:hypothetical protein